MFLLSHISLKGAKLIGKATITSSHHVKQQYRTEAVRNELNCTITTLEKCYLAADISISLCYFTNGPSNDVGLSACYLYTASQSSSSRVSQPHYLHCSLN
jgi:hypothetical protein